MNIVDRKQATAPADAQRWLESFGAALQAQDANAAADFFLADGLWRDVLAFTWTIQTMAGRRPLRQGCKKRWPARSQDNSIFHPSERHHAG